MSPTAASMAFAKAQSPVTVVETANGADEHAFTNTAHGHEAFDRCMIRAYLIAVSGIRIIVDPWVDEWIVGTCLIARAIAPV